MDKPGASSCAFKNIPQSLNIKAENFREIKKYSDILEKAYKYFEKIVYEMKRINIMIKNNNIDSM
ncbi:hypothetical protein UT300013_13070 [Paraclostridium sordellii]